MALPKSGSNFCRRRLARQARQMRENAGLTIEEAAPKLEKTTSSLSRMERGETRIDSHLLRSMMDLYDVRDDSLFDLARRANQSGWWQAYGVADLGYLDLETEACAIREYGGLNIPGLLQTEEYVRALLRTGPRWSEKQFESEVQVRLIRQDRLIAEEHPLELTVIIDEAALLREVGGAEVMTAQLRHLLAVAQFDRVSLQVLPFRSGVHDGMIGGFTLLRFPEPDDPDMLYIDHLPGAQHIEKAEQVTIATMAFDRLRSQALPPHETPALIEELLATHPYGRL